jgi:hypothetical protein
VTFGRLSEFEEDDGELRGPAVRTDSLLDASDGQPFETLREIGYESGDVLPLFMRDISDTFSVTTTSFVGRGNSKVQLPPPDTIPGTYVVGLSILIKPGTGETGFARIRQFLPTRNVVVGSEVFTTTRGGVFSGYTEFDPDTPSSPVSYELQIKTDPGNNSTTYKQYSITVGVKIP